MLHTRQFIAFVGQTDLRITYSSVLTGISLVTHLEKQYACSNTYYFATNILQNGIALSFFLAQGQRRAPDIVYSHQISFEQAFVGVAINVTVTRERLCKACDATGSSKPEEMPTVSKSLMEYDNISVRA